MSGKYMIERHVCPACRSIGVVTIFSYLYSDGSLLDYLKNYYTHFDARFLEDARYTLKQCKHCGLIFQHEVPNQEFLENLYDKWLFQQDAILPTPVQVIHELYSLSCHLNVHPTQLKVLDFGMGEGRWCRAAKSLGCDTHGFDLAESNMSSALKNGVHVTSWNEIPGNQFDFINTEQVFEHLVDPYGDLQQLVKGLSPKGIIKICVPNGNWLTRQIKGLDWDRLCSNRNRLNAVHPLEHVNCYSRLSLYKIAENFGLEAIRPSLRCKYAFIGKPKAAWTLPEPFLKSVIRPFYTPFNPRILYLWFQNTAE